MCITKQYLHLKHNCKTLCQLQASTLVHNISIQEGSLDLDSNRNHNSSSNNNHNSSSKVLFIILAPAKAHLSLTWVVHLIRLHVELEGLCVGNTAPKAVYIENRWGETRVSRACVSRVSAACRRRAAAAAARDLWSALRLVAKATCGTHGGTVNVRNRRLTPWPALNTASTERISLRAASTLVLCGHYHASIFFHFFVTTFRLNL
ncbi:unnamed protein product, partial [Iphiclides podalirius]